MRTIIHASNPAFFSGHPNRKELSSYEVITLSGDENQPFLSFSGFSAKNEGITRYFYISYFAGSDIHTLLFQKKKEVQNLDTCIEYSFS